MSDELENFIGIYLDTIPVEINLEYAEFKRKLNENDLFNGKQIYEYLEMTESDAADRINLCTFDRKIESINEDNMIEIIFNYRSHLLQVFMHPKLHLKEIQEILPIEVVKKTGPESIRHLAAHSEHWESIRVSGLVPARMNARSLEDEYAIYENIAAKNLVDRLYLIMRKKKRELDIIEYSFVAKESIYSLSGQQSNIYRAYNALFKGYSSDSIQGQVRERNKKQLEMIDIILVDLARCRESSLYSKLRRAEHIVGQLKPTNIFLMDKHYKYVYKLWKILKSSHYLIKEDIETDEQIGISDEYYWYVYSNLLFALKYSNFTEDKQHAFTNPIITYSCFGNWRAELNRSNIDFLGQKTIELNISINEHYQFNITENEQLIPTDFPAYLNGAELHITRKLNESEQAKLCNVLYPELGKNVNLTKDQKKIAQKIKEQRIDLKKQFYTKFKTNNLMRIKILIIPLYVKFRDGSIEADNALKMLMTELQNIDPAEEYQAIYIVTPFTPYDYDKPSKRTQTEAKTLLKYIYGLQEGMNRIGVLPMGVGDVNTFRRFCKVVLLSMISVDDNKKTCPICGEELYSDKSQTGVVKCYSCSFELMYPRCKSPNCKKHYLKSFFPTDNICLRENSDVSYRLLISEMNNSFKNIVDLDIESGSDICPHCNAVQR